MNNFLVNTTQLLKEKNITKNKLLTDLHLSKNSFVDWKQRGTVPSATVVISIAKYLDVSPSYLLQPINNKTTKIGGIVVKTNGIIKELSREERSYYVAADVMSLLGVSKSKAYDMIRIMRQELVDAGTISAVYPQGKIPKKYFNEKCMV